MHSYNNASCWLMHLIQFIWHINSSTPIQIMIIETCNIFVLGGYPATAIKGRTTALFMYIQSEYIEYSASFYIQNVQATAMLWPDPITIATNLIISAVTNDMKILPFQNCKIRNVFSYYGIIADDLVLYASKIIMTLSRS